MSFDKGLAQRIREYLQDYPDLEEKKMFGGLCFMISRHMCCGIIEDKLMARVGPEQYESLLERDHTLKMDFTGKPMKGMIFEESQGLNTDEKLKKWLDFCIEFINTLPPKK
ncbi:TfoX/Sxy family protein [Rhodohalobacter sulfatireducens]|uniref:TfoX/Sxy family protein n=1 Tax=Rhodohalobacter sulfatireducens TaxID=2911366 RepID=A0ABS9KG76_9BACT|nr:TfoX/Sxy family protein [Rhodohalobacter sulfatireducens]MCG2589864.1 TfoX/Sxy family protein [Rhodohalobacter sulfatireducens]